MFVLVLTLLLACLVSSEDPTQSWLMTGVKRVQGTEPKQDCAGVEVLTYHFRSEIVFRYATTSLRCRMRNCGDQAKQLNLTVIIQDTAFISNLSMVVDGVVYESSVREKQQADKDFLAAVTSGLGAAQVAVSAREANSYNIFVNLEPNSDVTLNLTYEELLIRRLNVYDHVITFNPGQPVKDMRAEVDIVEAQNISTLSVFGSNTAHSNDSGVAVLSDSVTVLNRTTSMTAHVFYSPRTWPPNQLNMAAEQLHVQYDVDRSSEAGDVVLMDGFFVHFFAPKSPPPISKHVVFALDTSGSMWGRKLQQTQEAMSHILRELRQGDYFSIITFGTKVEEWSPMPQNLVGLRTSPTTLEVTQRNIDSAIDYVQSLQASGGTNIITALRKSLQITARREYNLANITDQEEYNRILPKPMVVFLTDGVPTDGELVPTLILAKVRAANAQVKAAIFTLAFGDGASQAFLRRLALQNNGFSRRIYEAADVSLQLESFYQEISSPLLSNVTFVYKHHKLSSRSLTRQMFHTYYGGSEIVVVGELEANDNDQDDFLVEISCLKADGIQERSKTRPLTTRSTSGYKAKRSMGVLERMWAFLSIKQHLDQDIISEEKDLGSHKKEALRIALKYQFVTSLTSLVIVKPANESQVPMIRLDVPVEEPDCEVAPVETTAGVNIVPKPLLSFVFGSPTVAAKPTAQVHSATDISTTLHNDSTPQSSTPRNFTLAQLAWLPDHLDPSGHLVVANASDSQTPGLFTIYDPVLPQTDAAPPPCATPSGDIGTCRPVAHCVQPAFTDNFDMFLSYFCALGSLAGVCCPTGIAILKI